MPVAAVIFGNADCDLLRIVLVQLGTVKLEVGTPVAITDPVMSEPASDSGVEVSMGSVGDPYDNALAETEPRRVCRQLYSACFGWLVIGARVDHGGRGATEQETDIAEMHKQSRLSRRIIWKFL